MERDETEDNVGKKKKLKEKTAENVPNLGKDPHIQEMSGKKKKEMSKKKEG